MKKATIQDIARAANVSKSTVSRVLNGSAAVNEEKKQAVLEAIKRLGFKPNLMAQSLALGKSMSIGVMTQLIGSPFYDSIAQGIISGLTGTNYSPIFVDGRWQQENQADAINILLGRQVDGLVLIGGTVLGSEIIELCQGLPTVIVARELPPDKHHCLFMNNIDGGYKGTKHLIQLGHRKISFIHGVKAHPDAVDRCTGYKNALAEAGIEFDPELVYQGDFSAESGVNAINDFCERKKSFTAVFASNDTMAFGARLALQRHGLSVPEDVSIVGFDDQAESAFMTPPLTTIRQPGKKMGEMAVRGVLSLIDEEPFKSVELQGDLCIRESSCKRK